VRDFSGRPLGEGQNRFIRQRRCFKADEYPFPRPVGVLQFLRREKDNSVFSSNRSAVVHHNDMIHHVDDMVGDRLCRPIE